MTATDWIVISVYAAAMILLSLWLGRGQQSMDDYYVGGRNLPWWALGISTMATQTSAVSFLSIPAFVALKPGGGLTWLQFELALPLAMIGVSMLLLPFFRGLRLISIYEYLELRFGPSVRALVALVFLLSRALGTGIGLYASAIVLTVVLGLPIWITIIAMGLLVIVYDSIGGMRAVVWSDVIQGLILLLGIGLCVGYALVQLGGVEPMLSGLTAERLRAIDPSLGLNDATGVPFWGFLVGGLFLYMAYYGADQSQAQRELSTRSLEDTRRSLYLNGFARFPLSIGYILMGLVLAAVFAGSPDLQARVPADNLDFLVPAFIMEGVPAGVRGLLIAALLAASMSSLDSALNALSAATMRDFVARRREHLGRPLSQAQSLRLGRLATACWGLVVIGLAFLVGGISETVIEAINKIGSAFYGPILAAFLVGVLSLRATSVGIITGILAGVGSNLALWLFAGGVHWMWWNFTGLVVASSICWVVSRLGPRPPPQQVRRYTLAGSGFLAREGLWRPAYRWLLLYFLCMLALLQGITLLAQR
jgi:SSS family solute:Na+ symporter